MIKFNLSRPPTSGESREALRHSEGHRLLTHDQARTLVAARACLAAEAGVPRAERRLRIARVLATRTRRPFPRAELENLELWAAPEGGDDE